MALTDTTSRVSENQMTPISWSFFARSTFFYNFTFFQIHLLLTLFQLSRLQTLTHRGGRWVRCKRSRRGTSSCSQRSQSRGSCYGRRRRARSCRIVTSCPWALALGKAGKSRAIEAATSSHVAKYTRTALPLTAHPPNSLLRVLAALLGSSYPRSGRLLRRRGEGRISAARILGGTIGVWWSSSMLLALTPPVLWTWPDDLRLSSMSACCCPSKKAFPNLVTRLVSKSLFLLFLLAILYSFSHLPRRLGNQTDIYQW